MLKKIILGVVALATIGALAYLPNMISAKNNNSYVLPETEGVYDVPGRQNLKLKVFVHYEKNKDIEKSAKKGKPVPQLPQESCSLSSETDIDSTSVVSFAQWHLPSLWLYRINLDSVPSTIAKGDAESLIAKAYETWENVVGSEVSFIRGEDTIKNSARFDDQNIVSWGRTPGTALAITYTWYNPSTNLAVEIDTIMNSKFKWYWSDPGNWPVGEICAYQGVYDAQSILTHELGHTIGLDDEYSSEYAHNTMYGYGSVGETKKDTLTHGDIVGANGIYNY
jgi:hypothetical protein